MKRANKTLVLWLLGGGALLFSLSAFMPGLVAVEVMNNDKVGLAAQVELAETSAALSVPSGETRYLLRRFEGSNMVGLRGHPHCAPYYLPSHSVSFRQYSLDGTDCVPSGFRLTRGIILLLASAGLLAAMIASLVRSRRRRARPSTLCPSA